MGIHSWLFSTVPYEILVYGFCVPEPSVLCVVVLSSVVVEAGLLSLLDLVSGDVTNIPGKNKIY